MPDFRSEFQQHALQQAPHEACGLIVNGHYWRCRNIADDPTLDFALDPRDYVAASMAGKIEAIVHSHPMGGGASKADLRSCAYTKLPWHIWSMPDDRWLTITP